MNAHAEGKIRPLQVAGNVRKGDHAFEIEAAFFQNEDRLEARAVHACALGFDETPGFRNAVENAWFLATAD